MFTIIIPTYNRKEQLLTALNQLDRQSFKDFEVVIIDDASENEYDINLNLFSFDLTYHRNNINMGPAEARNIGVRLAKYDWVLFLDDDDFFLPEKLLLLKNNILNNDVDFIYHRARIFMINEGVSYITSQKNIENLKGLLSESIMESNFIGGPPNFAVKKSLFNSLGGFSERIRAIEDYEFLIRMLRKVEKNKILFIDKILTNCIYTTNTISVSKNINNLNYACDYILSHHIKGDRKARKMFNSNRALMMAHSLLMNLKRESSFYYIKAGFLKFNLKYLVSGVICLVSPALLIKIRGGFKNNG